MTPAAKLRPSPNVPGSMEAAVKMWLKVGNIQKLQQVREEETHLSFNQVNNCRRNIKGIDPLFSRTKAACNGAMALLCCQVKKGWEEEEGQCT